MGSFAAVTALEAAGPGAFTAQIHPDWTIAGKPNGGYLLALLGRAAVAVGAAPHVLAASAHYLRAPAPGPAQVVAEVLRAGRRTSALRARLSQDGMTCVEALVTTTTLDPHAEPVWTGGVPEPFPNGVRTPVDAIRLPSVNPAGMLVTIMGQVDLRLDRSSMLWADGRPTGRGELRGWLTLLDGEPFDPLSLLYAVDAFPPATFDVAASGWVPTIEFSAAVRGLPAPGPLRILQKARLIRDELVDEACWAWDSQGALVAHATQLAGIRLD